MLSLVCAAISGLAFVAAMAGVYALLAGWIEDAAVAAVVSSIALLISGLAFIGVLFWTASGTGGVLRDLRQQFLVHLDRLPLGWFTGTSAGRVRQAIHQDLDTLSFVLGDLYIMQTRALAVAAGGLVFFLFVSPSFTAVALVPTAVVAVLARRRSVPAIGEASRVAAAAQSRLSARAVEFGQGVAVRRAYPDGERHGAERVVGALRDVEEATKATERVAARDRRILLVFTHPAFAVLWTVATGVVFLAQGWMTPVCILAFLLVTQPFGDALQTLIGFRSSFSRSRVVTADYEAVMAEKQLQDVPAGAASVVTPDPPAIDIEEVTFSYDAGAPVLTGLSLQVGRGETVAVVGASGAGKSTIARLVPRFWDPDAGAVRILGDDIRTLSAGELYRRVAFVFQDVQLLQLTVRENIRLGDVEASDERVIVAAQAAQIHDRILALPRGYDSVIGEDAALSGGEAQRLTIARALLLDAPVVVLDEPTAHADPATEAAVAAGVATLTEGRAVLIVAHRLATVQHADQIIVIDQGEVVERGRYRDLIASGGAFARLWERQHREGAD